MGDDKAPMPPNEQNRPKTDHIIPVPKEHIQVLEQDRSVLRELNRLVSRIVPRIAPVRAVS